MDGQIWRTVWLIENRGIFDGVYKKICDYFWPFSCFCFFCTIQLWVSVPFVAVINSVYLTLCCA